MNKNKKKNKNKNKPNIAVFNSDLIIELVCVYTQIDPRINKKSSYRKSYLPG